MAHTVPPYLNKIEEKYQKELLFAEKKELRAKKDLEFASDYVKLCREKLEEVKKSA